MGAKQSGPAAANGRTRAYSGGDLPSGSGSGGGGANGTGGRPIGGGGRYTHLASGAHHAGPGGSAAAAAAAPPVAAPRSRSLGGPAVSGARAAHSAFNIPNSSSSGLYGSQDSVNSTPEDSARERPAAAGGGGGHGGGSGGPRLVIGSLPAHLSPHLFGGKDALSKQGTGGGGLGIRTTSAAFRGSHKMNRGWGTRNSILCVHKHRCGCIVV